MAKLDFAKAKADIAEIVEIVKIVPDTLQHRCFELLFEAAFSGPKLAETPREEAKLPPAKTPETPLSPGAQVKKLPTNVLAFARRQNVTEDELGKLFMLEHDPLLPIYKIPQGNISKAQLAKVMMVLLENGLLSNSLTAPYTELRQSVKDDDLYDGNFNKMLKRNAGLFKGAISEDSVTEDGTVELTGAGMEKLAEVVKELGQ
jgi:hypothetical protein